MRDGSGVTNMNSDPGGGSANGSPLLRVTKLRKRYSRGGPWAASERSIEALRGVDLTLQAGAALALIGASGSGKSTLARCLAHLEEPDAGEIWFAGQNWSQAGPFAGGLSSKKIQLIFQDPASSLNPRLTASEIVSEPLLIAGWGKKSDYAERAIELLALVGLSQDSAARKPRQFSGGQRRRLAIARALAVEPEVVILDEALAGLDLSTQAQIANLLLDLQSSRALTYLWISHDLSLLTRLTTEVALMDDGKIVEAAPLREFCENPRSHQARVLLQAWHGGRL